MEAVSLYTDGSCLGNPGPGGWAALLIHGERRKELAGGEEHTTNNRMELMAAIAGLEAIKPGFPVILTTDSQYVKNGIEQWLVGWKKKGWKTAAGKPVKNQDLWERLDKAVQAHPVTWAWVKGHNGHPENERVDELAQGQARAIRPGARLRI